MRSSGRSEIGGVGEHHQAVQPGTGPGSVWKSREGLGQTHSRADRRLDAPRCPG